MGNGMGTAFAWPADDRRSNAALAWLLVVAVLVAAVASLLSGEPLWAGFAAIAAAVVLLPPVALRSPAAMIPWELLLVVAAPLLASSVAGGFLGREPATYLSVAGLALVVTVELYAFTPVRMNRRFAVLVVVMATVTAAVAWELTRWTWGLLTGATTVAGNTALMWSLVTATVTGLVAGVLFNLYVRRLPSGTALVEQFGGVPAGMAARDSDPPDPTNPPEPDGSGKRLADRLGIAPTRQRRLVRAMQALLAGLLLYGLVRLNLSVVANGVVALGVTFLPALLRRDYDLPMDVGLTLWITVAMLLHVLGSAWLYEGLWWHALTHLVSGSLVGAVGYAAVRAVDEHTAGVHLPGRFVFAFIVLFVVSVGVLWEIFEFGLDGLASLLGRDALVLAQHGLTDTMTDLVATTVGAVVVATWGTAYLTRIANAMEDHMESG